MSDLITEYAEKEWQTAAFTNAKDLEACLRWFASRMNKEPHDSPDPVVVRLEAEVVELSGKVGELREAQLHAAGDGDTWRAACKRVEAELDGTRGQVDALTQAVAEALSNFGKEKKKAELLTQQLAEARAECERLAHFLARIG